MGNSLGYILRDREAGNIIEAFPKYEDAKAVLDGHEAQDKADGIYTEDFYEIVESEIPWHMV